jgi:hypothetical protein
MFISLMIDDDDEDDNSYVAKVLHFRERLTCQGHTPPIKVLTKSGNSPVVLVIFHFSEICEQAPSLLHEVDESRFFYFPIGFTAHPPWVGIGLSLKLSLCLCWDSNPDLPPRSQ